MLKLQFFKVQLLCYLLSVIAAIHTNELIQYRFDHGTFNHGTSNAPLLIQRSPPDPFRLVAISSRKESVVDAFFKHQFQLQKRRDFVRDVARDNRTADKERNGCASTDDLHALLDSIVCRTTYLQSIVSASKNCNLFGYFDSDHIRSCGRDSNGTYCRKYERNFPDPDYYAWDVLQECTLQTRSTKCSETCQAALQTFAKKFGCCIHVSRVSWFVEDNPHILVLSPALWSFCGVKWPQPCGNTPTPPSGSIAGSCTYGCYAYARSALICSEIGSDLIDAYNSCGRRGPARELQQLCGLNHRGKACFELQFTDNTDYLLSIYTACFRYFSSGECKTKCHKALKRFRKTYGCCVNVYNGTAFGDSSQLIGSIVTQYGLWSECGVITPEMCEMPDPSSNTTYNVEAFCEDIMTDGGADHVVKTHIFAQLFISLLGILLWTVL